MRFHIFPTMLISSFMYMYYMVYFLFFTGDIHTNNNAFIDFLE